jgi:hypothetical protein
MTQGHQGTGGGGFNEEGGYPAGPKPDRRGISIAALLEELSDQAERHAAFEDERMATLDDAERSEVQSEDLDWDATAGDGIE